MLFIVLICLIPGAVGSAFGKQLAAKGITAENALEKHQRFVYVILTVLSAVGAVIFGLASLKLANRIPTIVLLYIGGHANHFMLALASFGLGLLVFLEWPGRRNPKRLRQMLAGIAAILLPFWLLVYYSLPVTPLLRDRPVVDGVVLQSTPYSCAAATIATLARYVGKHPNLTERDVVAIAGTNRLGTSILAEIRAMRQLGLAPEYKQNLKVEELVKIAKPAVLHVMEPVGGTRIQHAIALLQVKAKERSLVVGNPLYGRQVKRFRDMQDYWLGEAVFVTEGAFDLSLPTPNRSKIETPDTPDSGKLLKASLTPRSDSLNSQI